MKKMSKEEKRELILTTIVCLIPIAAGLILYPMLPDQIPIHWDINGNVDNMASKFTTTVILPGMLMLLNLAFPFLLRIDPKYTNMDAKLRTITHWIIPVIAVICSGFTLAGALDVDTNVQIIAPMLVGVVFVVIGNYLPKTKQSYTMGIKLPWTLDSEENWNHTHRLAGFLWVIGGLLMIVSALLPCKVVPIIVIGLIITIVPCVYSYLFYLKETREK